MEKDKSTLNTYTNDPNILDVYIFLFLSVREENVTKNCQAAEGRASEASAQALATARAVLGRPCRVVLLPVLQFQAGLGTRRVSPFILHP